MKSYEHSDIQTTTVYILPTLSIYPDSSEQPWITAYVEGQLRHPLTLKHYPYNLPANFDITKLNPSPLAIAHHIPSSSFAKLLVVPNPTPKYNNVATYYGRQYLHGCTMLALCKDGQLRERLYGLASWWPWEKLSYRGTDKKFDDIVLYNGYIYGVDSEGVLYLIINQPGKLCIDRSLDRCPDATVSRWRNRLLVEWGQLYIVIRSDEKVFHVYTSISQGKGCLDRPVKIDHFMPKHVLFMAKDYYFFCRVGLKFPGMQLENCIVFSQDAFTRDGAWGFSQSGDGISIYRLRDKMLSREGELGELPKLDWSPPPWVLDSCPGLSAESSSHSERDPGKDECLDSKSTDENAGEMEPDSVSQDTEQEVIESDTVHTESENEEDVQMRSDFNSPETEDEEAIRVLTENAQNRATKEGDLVKNITTESIPTACTPRSMMRCSCDLATTRFEGCDVRSDVVPTLQKIWRNYGNITKNSNFRNRNMITTALECLSDMVQILENNSALSLSDSQADYLSSTLSDLRCMQFEVNWLIPLVDKAIKLHGSKHLQEPLNRISQSRSQVEKREAVLLEELAKLKEEKNKLNEEEVKVSMGIPFSGKFKFDELFGSRLT